MNVRALRPRSRPRAAALVAALLAAGFLARAAIADIARREIGPAVSVTLDFADSNASRCEVRAWSGVGLEGSCGSYRWDQLTLPSAFGTLKSLAIPKESAAAKGATPKDGDAVRDALTIILSLELSAASSPKAKGVGTVGPMAIEWAKRAGLDGAAIARATADARILAQERERETNERTKAALARLTPESADFPKQPWTTPDDKTFAEQSARILEAARGLLARAGGSATLHDAARVSVLAETAEAADARDAAALEVMFEEWSDRLAKAGVPVSAQARIPVVFVGDRDRWRQLVATSFGGDPTQHAESVTIYPVVGEAGAPPLAIVLVAPDGDRARARFAAAVGLARAMLHYTGDPTRGATFLNEGLPRVMADLSFPKAGMDKALRQRGLAAVRSGGSFAQVLGAGYEHPMWQGDQALARSLSYMFVRWLWDNEPTRLLRLARAPRVATTAAGEAIEARFARIMSISSDAAAARAQRWFMTND